MSRVCELTGVGPRTGNNVSHSNIKLRRRWLPNLKSKKYFIEDLGCTMSMRLSTRAIRTIDKQGGITAALLHARDEALSQNLLRAKRAIQKKRRPATKNIKAPVGAPTSE